MRPNVQFLVPDTFLRFLDQWQVENPSAVKTVRGYKVKTSLTASDPEEQKRKREALAKLMVESMRKK